MNDYREFTSVDNCGCLYAKQRSAEKAFCNKGITGKVTLNRVTDSAHKLHLFWVCKSSEHCAVLPLFTNDIEYSSLYYLIRDEVVDGEFIYNNGVCYISHMDDKGIAVLKLEKLLYQELVESVCHAQKIETGDIYPATFRTVQDHQHFTSCWVNEVDNQCVIFPIDFRDIPLIDNTNINSLNFSDAIVGDRICAHGIYYLVDKGPKEKFHLTKSPMQVIKQKSSV